MEQSWCENSVYSMIRERRDETLKVMVVEDEPDIRDIVKNLLEKEGFEVVVLENGLNIVEDLSRLQPDLLLLDQLLPGKTGIEIVREVRANQQFAKLPIIMVTGLSGEEDKVTAFDIGADDYVTKPFYPKELAARIRAVARRSNDGHAELQQLLTYDRMKVDFSAHKVFLDEREVHLTLTEFKILTELLRQSGTVLTRERLRERALGNLNVTDRTIDVHMASLRKKLSPLGKQIETVRGVGYRFAQ